MKLFKLFILVLVVSSTTLFAQKRTSESAAYVTYVFQPLNGEIVDNSTGIFMFNVDTELNTLDKSDVKTVTKGVKKDRRPKAILDARNDTLYKYEESFEKYKEKFSGKGDKYKDLRIEIEIDTPTIDFLANSFKELKGSDIALKLKAKAMLKITSSDRQLLYEKDLFASNPKALQYKASSFVEYITLKSQVNKAGSDEARRAIMQQHIRDEMHKKIFKYAIYYAHLDIQEQLFSDSSRELIYIFGAKGSHPKYKQLTELQETLADRFKKLYSFSKKKKTTMDQVMETIDESIPLWEELIAEANYEDKKAKVNGEIADGLKLNLALAYTMKRDFDKALEIMNTIEKAKENPNGLNGIMAGSFKGQAKSLRRLLERIQIDPSKVSVTTGQEAN
ncbi:hypothetical protein KMW28_04945 [Flammeovirga yaeyamensis]|uniref:Tetratricopeptide repeat protein n=1 Tax=Flammeovirga yaeyamensis TaxID=367791 RepID=A0AAX1N9L6_9BACT|nr:hypothetical protein [Flammeovirga yaeyamensis]MBB3697504.1 hypothetical protein [Flammeovirga yaeyamensis]NMF36198.1 hypothetical protein [Flammeovirga yaeyamensis]QWG02930.1 hypothetical protein KMW28_04945 [Flammeovirga yaeyamensis]